MSRVWMRPLCSRLLKSVFAFDVPQLGDQFGIFRYVDDIAGDVPRCSRHERFAPETQERVRLLVFRPAKNERDVIIEVAPDGFLYRLDTPTILYFRFDLGIPALLLTLVEDELD